MARRVEVLLVGDSRGAQKAVNDYTGALKRGETQLDRTAKKMQSAGSTISRSVTRFVVPAAVATVAAFGSFDSKLTQSTAIMANVGTVMRERMGDVAKQVSTDLNISASSAAESYFFLASAGMDANQAVAAMPAVARFAKAGMFDMATATDLATDAQSALGLSVDDSSQNLANLTRVTDVFARANELANTSVQQVAEAMTNKAGAALRVLNKDVEEGVAVLAAYADQGVKGVAAGEQLNIVLRDLQRAASANEDAFDAAGIAVYDANGNMRNMADIVGGLEGHLDGMSDAQRRAALETLGFQDKSMSALMTLLGTSDAIRTYEGELRNAAGTVQRITDKQMTAFNEKMGQAKQEIIGAAISLGEELAPMALSGAEAVAGLVKNFADLPDPIRNTVGAVALLTAASGPAFIAGGKLLGTYSALGKSLKALTTAKAITQVGTGIEAIGASAQAATSSRALGALQFILSPAGALTAGLAAVAVGALLVKRNVDQMAEAHASAAEGAEDLAGSLGLAYKTIEEAAADAADGAGTTAHAFAQANAAAIKSLRDLRSEADRADYLFEIGYQLVQRGTPPDQAFDAIRQLAAEAGVEIPVEVDADSLASFTRHLEAVSGTAERVAREIEANWRGMGTATKETMTGIAQAAADAFKLGDADQAIATVAEFEAQIRASGLSTTYQRKSIDFLNDEFAKLTGIAGWTNDGLGDLDTTLRQVAAGETTAAREAVEMAKAYLEARDAGMDQAAALAEARRATDDGTRANETATDRLTGLARAHGVAADAADDQEDAQGDLGDEVDDTTEKVEEQTSALEEQSVVHRAAIDPMFAVRKAQRDLKQAQEDYTKALAENGEASDEAEEAYEKLVDAALDVEGSLGMLQTAVGEGEVSVDEMRDAVQRLADLGLIPPGLVDQAVADLQGFIPEAESAAYGIGVGIADGASRGVYDKINNLSFAARAMVRKALASAKSEIESTSPSKKFAREVGEPIAQGVAVGIESATPLVDEAIDELLDQARDRATDGVSAITGAFGAAAGRTRAQGGLEGARSELADAEARRGAIADEITAVQQRMHLAKLEGREVTADEERDVLRAEQAKVRAEERLAQLHAEGGSVLDLRIAELDLAQAERDLARVQAESTAATKDYTAASEELAALQAELAELPTRIAKARQDLTAAELDAIEAEKRLADAGADLLGQGPAGEQMFASLAAAAGLEEAAVARLVARYRELAAARAGQPDAAGITRPTGADAVTTVAPALADALRKVGHDPGAVVDTADIAAGLARIGHDAGANIDQADIEVLLRNAAKRHSGGLVTPSMPTIPGLAPDERPVIGRVGEEWITADDPRHRRQRRPSTTPAAAAVGAMVEELLREILDELRRRDPIELDGYRLTRALMPHLAGELRMDGVKL